MRLLIDTQIFIWTVLDSDKLGPKARQITLIHKRLQFLQRLSLKVKNVPDPRDSINATGFLFQGFPLQKDLQEQNLPADKATPEYRC
jgi:hypothetical protein